MTSPTETELRYEAAESQGWRCALCAFPMVDYRECQAGGELEGRAVPICWATRRGHPEIAKLLPRFRTTDKPDVHTGTLRREGLPIAAAHRSCVASFQAKRWHHEQNELIGATTIQGWL